MSRLNPLYIALLLVGVLLFMMMRLHSAQQELNQEKLLYSKTQLLADKIYGLKSTYFNKTKVQRSLNTILRRSLLRNANITKKVTNSSFLITSDNMNIRSLNFLMSKVLNGTYDIAQLKIRRLSDEKASLKMEIKW